MSEAEQREMQKENDRLSSELDEANTALAKAEKDCIELGKDRDARDELLQEISDLIRKSYFI